MKTQRKLFPAMAMLLVSALILSMASYAWFTMSRTVSATGMELTATAPTNLLISNAVDGTYAESAAVTANPTGQLIPASTNDGINFFAANNVTNSGGNTLVGAANNDTTWVNGTGAPVGTTDGYYADYKFWLKTTGTQNVDVTVSQLAALTNATTSGNSSLGNAVKFAILDKDGVAISGATKYITNANNTSLTYPTGVTGPIATTATINSTTNKLATDEYKGEAAAYMIDGDGTKIFTVTGGTTGTDNTPIEITIRVWFEGQSAACVNAVAAKTTSISVGFSDTTYLQGLK